MWRKYVVERYGQVNVSSFLKRGSPLCKLISSVEKVDETVKVCKIARTDSYLFCTVLTLYFRQKIGNNGGNEDMPWSPRREVVNEKAEGWFFFSKLLRFFFGSHVIDIENISPLGEFQPLLYNTCSTPLTDYKWRQNFARYFCIWDHQILCGVIVELHHGPPPKLFEVNGNYNRF